MKSFWRRLLCDLGWHAESDARLDRWFGAYCEAKALGGSGRAGLYRLMALADAEVAAAVAEERATTGRRIEAALALCDEADRAAIPGMPGVWVNANRVRAALASPREES